MFCLVSCDVTYTKTEISESSFSSSYADSPIVGKWICQSIKKIMNIKKEFQAILILVILILISKILGF